MRILGGIGMALVRARGLQDSAYMQVFLRSQGYHYELGASRLERTSKGVPSEIASFVINCFLYIYIYFRRFDAFMRPI